MQFTSKQRHAGTCCGWPLSTRDTGNCFSASLSSQAVSSSHRWRFRRTLSSIGWKSSLICVSVCNKWTVTWPWWHLGSTLHIAGVIFIRRFMRYRFKKKKIRPSFLYVATRRKVVFDIPIERQSVWRKGNHKSPSGRGEKSKSRHSAHKLKPVYISDIWNDRSRVRKEIELQWPHATRSRLVERSHAELPWINDSNAVYRYAIKRD